MDDNDFLHEYMKALLAKLMDRNGLLSVAFEGQLNLVSEVNLAITLNTVVTIKPFCFCF